MHISHGEFCSFLDEPESSILQTTVCSWNADAVPTLEPISSGYRLALCYLLHAPETPRPRLLTIPTLLRNYSAFYSPGSSL